MVQHGAKGTVTIVVGTEYYSLSTAPESVDNLLRLKSLLDGRRTIREVAALRGIPLDEVFDVVDQFEDMGLLRAPPDQLNTISGEEFVCQIEKTAVMWARQIGYHRIFSKLSNGTTTRAVALGLLLESYHHVKSSSRHISTAISHATDEKARSLLRKYLVDEHDHDQLFARALEHSGIPGEFLRSAHPTIGTLSLANMLCEIGRRSTLAYISCTSLFEARSSEADQAEAEFRAICARYEIPTVAADLFVQHFRADLSAGHSSLLRKYVSDHDQIDAADAHEVVNCMHDLKHAFDQYHDQILAYYEDISNYIPRPRVDFFCL